MAGLKTLAKELQSKGRNGDTILAHINPQEAGILKALGGSGTRNPDTGLPEFFYKRYISPAIASINPFNPGSGLSKTINTTPIIGDINKAANQLGTQIFQPVEKAIVQPASRGLADLEKTVNKVVPGGYATVGQIALAAMGAPAPLQIGYGAARGGGLLRTGSSLEKTNLQGAVVGGATAYASTELADYMRGAVPPGTEAGPALLPESVPITDYSTDILTGEFIPPPPSTGSPMFQFGPEAATPELLSGPGSIYDVNTGTGLGAGEYSGYMDVGSNVNEPLVQLSGPGSIYDTSPPPSFLDKIATKSGDAVSDTVKFVTEPTKAISTAGKTGEGITNLLGAGEMTAKEAAALAAKTGVDPIKMAGIVIAGESTLAGMEEQRKYLEEAKRANAISQAEYDRAMASINSQRDYAAEVVSKNQFNPNPSRDVSIGETYYGRTPETSNLYARTPSMLYAMGGQVDDEMGGDYSAMGMDQGNMQKGLFGLGYAEGGTPRFLSGGGDGMSDSIPATINNKQPARLADGEFVIPADVVSHIGNGSSKAGAKQLYSMMDKVRKARTGNEKQGKQINPRKYLPA